MDRLDLKRKLVCEMPAVPAYCDVPKFKGDFHTQMYYWDDDVKDYRACIKEAHFDGKYFHLYDLDAYEAVNWIDDWSYFTTNIKTPVCEGWINEVNKGWRNPSPLYCKFNPETKKYEILKEDKLKLLKE
jgi:hypothetical protein